MTMDVISITDIRLMTRIGVTEEERSRPQPVLVSVEIDADLSRARSSDDLSDTVDYHGVITEVAALVGSSDVRLLEHLADKIANEIARMNLVSGVTVQVRKESPPIEEDVGAISIRVGKR
jgi:dihydroneopterin aldolase